MLFNEAATPIDTALDLDAQGLLNPVTGAVEQFDGRLRLDGYELRVLVKNL
jgi:hypothetical protein